MQSFLGIKAKKTVEPIVKVDSVPATIVAKEMVTPEETTIKKTGGIRPNGKTTHRTVIRRQAEEDAKKSEAEDKSKQSLDILSAQLDRLSQISPNEPPAIPLVITPDEIEQQLLKEKEERDLTIKQLREELRKKENEEKQTEPLILKWQDEVVETQDLELKNSKGKKFTVQTHLPSSLFAQLEGLKDQVVQPWKRAKAIDESGLLGERFFESQDKQIDIAEQIHGLTVLNAHEEYKKIGTDGETSDIRQTIKEKSLEKISKLCAKTIDTKVYVDLLDSQLDYIDYYCTQKRFQKTTSKNIPELAISHSQEKIGSNDASEAKIRILNDKPSPEKKDELTKEAYATIKQVFETVASDGEFLETIPRLKTLNDEIIQFNNKLNELRKGKLTAVSKIKTAPSLTMPEVKVDDSVLQLDSKETALPDTSNASTKAIKSIDDLIAAEIKLQEQAAIIEEEEKKLSDRISELHIKRKSLIENYVSMPFPSEVNAELNVITENSPKIIELRNLVEIQGKAIEYKMKHLSYLQVRKKSLTSGIKYVALSKVMDDDIFAAQKVLSELVTKNAELENNLQLAKDKEYEKQYLMACDSRKNDIKKLQEELVALEILNSPAGFFLLLKDQHQKEADILFQDHLTMYLARKDAIEAEADKNPSSQTLEAAIKLRDEINYFFDKEKIYLSKFNNRENALNNERLRQLDECRKRFVSQKSIPNLNPLIEKLQMDKLRRKIAELEKNQGGLDTKHINKTPESKTPESKISHTLGNTNPNNSAINSSLPYAVKDHTSALSSPSSTSNASRDPSSQGHNSQSQSISRLRTGLTIGGLIFLGGIAAATFTILTILSGGILGFLAAVPLTIHVVGMSAGIGAGAVGSGLGVGKAIEYGIGYLVGSKDNKHVFPTASASRASTANATRPSTANARSSANSHIVPNIPTFRPGDSQILSENKSIITSSIPKKMIPAQPKEKRSLTASLSFLSSVNKNQIPTDSSSLSSNHLLRGRSHSA